jgi:hypothetical protein
MASAIDEFKRRLALQWLPSFCDARAHRDFAPGGFLWETAARLTEFDARWFLVAVDAGFVHEDGGFFTAPMSQAKEQLFSSGSAKESPRSFTLWTEPIITIGALGRLHVEFSWPADRLGCQSKDWGLDLACYDHSGRMAVGGEVKKARREVITLLEEMARYANDPELPEPPNGPRRNAYKKVLSIRRNPPSLFWAVGPERDTQLFDVAWLSDAGRMVLQASDERQLMYDSVD